MQNSIKFWDMPYERPDVEDLKAKENALTERLISADSYEAAREVFIEEYEMEKHIRTMNSLATIRHTIDTRDEFYDAENDFWDAAMPELAECAQRWTMAMLDSPFREQFEEEFGDVMFLNAEIELKSFSPAIIEDMQKEAALVSEYNKLIASAQIDFNGGTYTISQLSPFKNDADDEIRLAAWQAEGQWYKDHGDDLDRIYDELVKLRDGMGRKMGYDGYTELGYYRMGRNCYTKDDVEKFREAVQKYLVPVADKLLRAQAERIGVSYPLSFADAQLEFRSGNPVPQGTPDEILEAGRKFYSELSPETGEFFNMMLDRELMDVLSTEGKQAGGYCTGIPDYGVPFIFANFNGYESRCRGCYTRGGSCVRDVYE